MDDLQAEARHLLSDPSQIYETDKVKFAEDTLTVLDQLGAKPDFLTHYLDNS